MHLVAAVSAIKAVSRYNEIDYLYPIPKSPRLITCRSYRRLMSRFLLKRRLTAKRCWHPADEAAAAAAVAAVIGDAAAAQDAHAIMKDGAMWRL